MNSPAPIHKRDQTVENELAGRIAKGALIAPLAAIPASLLLASIVVLPESGLAGFQFVPGLALFLGIYATPMAYLFTMIYGLPVAWLLNRIGARGLPLSLLLSLLPQAVLLTYLGGSVSEMLDKSFYFIYGLAVGAVLWRIAVRNN